MRRKGRDATGTLSPVSVQPSDRRKHVKLSSKWIVFLLAFVLIGSSRLLANLVASDGDSDLPIHTNTRGGTVKASLIRSERSEKKECTIWMAESSLIGHEGFGIFTTRPLEAEERVLGGPDGLSIPIVHYAARRRQPNYKAHKAWLRVWDNYVWGRGVPDHVSYEEPPDIVDYQINFGALPNHHCVKASLDIQYPDRPYDDTLVDRSSPAAGAITYSRGREFTVERPAKAGDELFLDYGYCTHNGDPEWTDHIFMTEDFRQAADLMMRYKRGKEKGIDFGPTGKVIVPIGTDKLVAGLLPQTKDEFQQLTRGVDTRKNLVQVLAEKKSIAPRKPEWIKSNGMCLEHMVPRKSTLPLAGQGGIAQHLIRKGEMIVPAPLLQIPDRSALDIYDGDFKKIGTQLVLNYCFAHPESSLLLCPDTNAVLINHCSARKKQCGPKGPNANYRWSSGWDKTSDEWRKMSLDDISAQSVRGLAFEFFALRDIQEGEEIFIDYGADWEQAWERHVTNWKPPAPIESFISAKDANENTGPILDVLVSGDLRETVQHPYLFTGCQYYASEQDEHRYYKTGYANWRDLSDDEILERFADDGGEYVYEKGGYSKHGDGTHWPCTVLRRDSDGTYAVRIHQNPWEDSLPWDEHDLPRILTGYRRDSIHYFVQPLATDQHLPQAFRFPIGMKDEMLPEQWKNLPRNNR